ncbi:MAG TPA: helix-turn-helix domain-containing protein [Terriglobales bacterium]|jgi:cytoskeleton protein RodZ|nr:helix-turn-helix domain-containing protein [Terriglobales bacterium]
MTSFGEKLQREREMRGVTLEEIAEATKIGTRNLRALEQNDFDKLPGGIFNKGFVRAYARYLGIDEEQAVADYLAASGQAEAPATGPLPDVPPTVKLTVRRRSPWRLVVLGVLLLAAAYVGWRAYSQRYARADDSSVPAAPLPATETKAAPPSTSAATNSSSPAGTVLSGATSPAATGAGTPTPAASAPAAAQPAPAESAPAAGFTLEVRAKRDCWVAITVDGKSAGNQLLKAPGQQSIHANREIVMTVGNAGGLEFSLNGKPLPPQGSEGQKRTLTFTAKDGR